MTIAVAPLTSTNEPAWLVAINDQLIARITAENVPPHLWVFGYVRISQDEKESAEGVHNQARGLLAKANRDGVYLAHIFCDNDISGAKVDRPALTEMLRGVRSTATKAVMARDVARLTRNLQLGMDLYNLGANSDVRFLFTKESECDLTTADGRKTFMNRVVDAVNYRESNTENMLVRMKSNAAKGRRQGGSRQYGYGAPLLDADGKPIIDPRNNKEIVDPNAPRADEVAALLEGRNRVLNGESQTTIIADWTARGILRPPCKQNGYKATPWRVGKLAETLLQESYVIYDEGEHTDPETGLRCECLDNPEGGATRVHGPSGARHRAQWPGLWTRADREAMQVNLRSHRQAKDKNAPRQRNRAYWMTGLITCGGEHKDGEPCTSYMVGQPLQRVRPDGTIHHQRRYGCRAKDSAKRRIGCGRVFRDANALETFVAEQVIAAYEDPEILGRLDRSNDHADKIAAIQRRIETAAGHLDAEVDKRTAAMVGGEADEDDLRVFDRTIAGLKQSLKDLRTEQDSLRSAHALAVLADIGNAGDLRKAWDTKGPKWRHETAARLIEKVIVKPARVYAASWTDQNDNVYRFDEHSVEIIWRKL